jgi:hypothetical protein
VVKQERPQVILQILAGENPISARLLRLWRLHVQGRALFARLMQELSSRTETVLAGGRDQHALRCLGDLVPALVCSGPQCLDHQWLTRQLSACGLFWENKVARWALRQQRPAPAQLLASDIKGSLLDLQRSVQVEEGVLPRHPLGDAVSRALAFVEQQQQFNALSGPGLGQWFWFIPGGANQHLYSAEIFIDEEQQGDTERGAGDGGFRLRLCVELSRLGPVEASLNLDRDRISCQLRVGEEALAQWLRPYLPALRSALEGRGFQVVSLGCDAGPIQRLPPCLAADQRLLSSLLHVVV